MSKLDIIYKENAHAAQDVPVQAEIFIFDNVKIVIIE